jgi:tyramine---L-glutamate ligase
MHQIDDGNNMQNKSRLKIWVCEYVSAGGLASEALPASLLQEGLLMRDALLADLSALNIDCITSHDVRVAPPKNAHSLPVSPEDDVLAIWRKQLATDDIDACWVIAPETDDVLHQMYTLAQEAEKDWIGCSGEAIRKTSSKSLMADICARAEVSVIPHVYLNQAISLISLPWYVMAKYGWVVKPDDGAGCEFTYHINNDSELIEFNKYLKNNLVVGYERLLLQPYVEGHTLSMSVISTKTQVRVIAGHLQSITVKDGKFGFHGAGVNQASEYLPMMQTMAEQIHSAIPGLTGYWGADMILTADNQLTLVEINPRLTTPYIGLSSLLADNPAQMILDATLHNKLTATQAVSSFLLTLPSEQARSIERRPT